MELFVYENEDILKEAGTNTNIIPDYVMNFSEAALYVAEAVEEDFNALFESIGVNELAVYESTGSQIVYEGAKFEELKKNVINFFVKLWESAKGLFEDAISKFNKFKSEATAKLSGKINIDSLPDDAKLGSIHEFPDLKQMFGANAKTFTNEVINKFDKLSGGFTGDSDKSSIQEKISTTEKELIDQIISKISGFNSSNVQTMQKEIKDKYLGKKIDVDGKYAKSNFNSIKNTVIHGGAIPYIKQMYKSYRSYIDTCISDAKKYTDKRAITMSAEIKVLKTIATVLNSANSAIMGVYKTQCTEYGLLLAKIATKCKAPSKEKSANESVAAIQMDLIESAFNW